MSAIKQTFLVSSVIRGAEHNQTHGGLYIVDFRDGTARLCLDWADTTIDIAGRGGDRGLRGLAVTHEGIWVAASAAILLLDRNFNVRGRFESPYLRHAHEIALDENSLFVVSTGFDAILRFDRASRSFDLGYHLYHRDGGIAVAQFDPVGSDGPRPVNDFHLNNVCRRPEGLYFSGLRAPALFRVCGMKLSIVARLPIGTHNAQPFQGGVIFNDTASNRLTFDYPGGSLSIDVCFDFPVRVSTALTHSPIARPYFARGLLPLNATQAVGGVSPSTLCLYDLPNRTVTQRVRLSDDIHNAIHGIAAWPVQQDSEKATKL